MLMTLVAFILGLMWMYETMELASYSAFLNAWDYVNYGFGTLIFCYFLFLAVWW